MTKPFQLADKSLRCARDECIGNVIKVMIGTLEGYLGELGPRGVEGDVNSLPDDVRRTYKEKGENFFVLRPSKSLKESGHYPNRVITVGNLELLITDYAAACSRRYFGDVLCSHVGSLPIGPESSNKERYVKFRLCFLRELLHLGLISEEYWEEMGYAIKSLVERKLGGELK